MEKETIREQAMRKEAYTKPTADILVMSPAGMLAASNQVSIEDKPAETEQRGKEDSWSME